jgi:hypothetical protein
MFHPRNENWRRHQQKRALHRGKRLYSTWERGEHAPENALTQEETQAENERRPS